MFDFKRQYSHSVESKLRVSMSQNLYINYLALGTSTKIINHFGAESFRCFLTLSRRKSSNWGTLAA